MIIDAHTHVFPDKIADRSIEVLENTGKQKAVIGGKVSDLLKSMEESGVNKSIVLPVLTKPEHFESVNRFSAKLNESGKLIAFAGIHPLCENINKLLDFIAESGFKGVKLHPDYQGTDITDEGYVKIIEGCRKRGLIVMIHAGPDPAYPEHIHCPLEGSAEVVKELTKDKPFIVLAHFGGIKQLDAIERRLIGLPVYIDTSFALDSIQRERVCEIIKLHGYRKVLFGTDSPWRDQKEYIQIIKSLPFKETECDAILEKNCAELLSV